MDQSILARIYGRGWAFPPAFSVEDGVEMVDSAIDVGQSLRILFCTEPGERIMRENYGCALYDVMFANIDSELLSDIETRILDSVLRYEPRADVTGIDVEQSAQSPYSLEVQVRYTLRGSQIAEKLAGIFPIDDAQGGRISWVL
ncbi:GPW/gp25 family protein [Paraburkholderia sp. D15]|uniref:GPW/gp25 family protein n=1 Tax=Paraburkholderia sp. D15 TaxID=2880218 RepID=UPI002478E78F|nr:GPW/gp25 family protein [Paraburkholderia sp. D15]WGS53955.1 GPW/gp25 family protein [Paraburkholderia sp. D15]WKF60509.1 hypothetical protein HUO10_005030 [Paraburkholderia busanensis]